MIYRLLPIVAIFLSSSAYASGTELKQTLENIFYWVAGIGLFISVGTITAAKVWPDSWIEPMAQRYSKQLSWAVFAFLVFGIFKGQVADFFTWFSNPIAGIFN